MSEVELQGDLTAAVNSLKQCIHLGFHPAENYWNHLEPMEKKKKNLCRAVFCLSHGKFSMSPASEVRKHLNLEARVRGGGKKGKPEMWKTRVFWWWD